MVLAAGDDALAEFSGPWCSEALTLICPLCAWLYCHNFMLGFASLVLSPLLSQHVSSCSPLAANPLPSLTAPISVTRPELYAHVLSATTDRHPNAA